MRTFDEFWAGATRHLLDAPTRAALNHLAAHDGEPSLAAIESAAACSGAPLGPVAAAYGYLPRIDGEGYYNVAERNRWHAVLDKADPATLACFAFWRHRGLAVRTKVVACWAKSLVRKPPHLPAQPLPEHFGPHPHAVDND